MKYPKDHIPESRDELVYIMNHFLEYNHISVRNPDDNDLYHLIRDNVDQKTRDKILMEQITNHQDKDGFSLIHNNFPYSHLLSKLPEIEHYILWYLVDKTVEEIEAKIKSYNFEWYYWKINEAQIKSIPYINHAQVFFVRSNEDERETSPDKLL